MLILKADTLQSSCLAHAFFGRPGGVSTGVYAGLNCGPGSNDDCAAVITNRARALKALGGEALITLYQIHSANVVTVTAPWQIGESPQGDAMVTNVPGIALGILTADCAPVLLADVEAGVIGAAHAGWKGAIAGVTDSAIIAMEMLGARRERIAAAIGPCIAQTNYEVDEKFRTTFVAADAANSGFFIASDKPSHFRFDLEGYVASRLRDAGIKVIASLHADTYAHDDRFFSYRRATHRGEKDYGRDLSAILLKP